MGKSYTYNVIGRTEIIDNRCFEYPAMNKLEMAQAKIKAQKHGHPIMSWYAQTNIGCTMLNIPNEWDGVDVKDSAIKHVKLVKCICNGAGCFVCDYSGYTKKNHWNKWQPWQLESVYEKATKTI